MLITGIVFGVNWKREVPFTRRELPLALGAIAVSALSDFLVSNYVWGQHEVDIIKLTGFKNGIYVNPERMKQMRLNMGNKQQVRLDDDLIIEDDDEDEVKHTK